MYLLSSQPAEFESVASFTMSLIEVSDNTSPVLLSALPLSALQAAKLKINARQIIAAMNFFIALPPLVFVFGFVWFSVICL
jgi:hypothetical protein